MLDKKIKQLKNDVFEANLKLYRLNLVLFTFGNVSGIDRDKNLVAIKPSGVGYDKLTSEDIVVVGLDGKTIYGNLNPSSDTKTHLQLYKFFPEIGGVAHTHSKYATIMAQAKIPVKCFGTTHADYFYGDVPCTEVISDESIRRDYEEETGNLIIQTFIKNKINYKDIKACLVASHGPFSWGKNPDDAVFASEILEEVSMQNCFTRLLNPEIKSMKKTLLDKHYLRKHGKDAYYGQSPDS